LSLAQAAERSCAGVNSLRVTANAAPMLPSKQLDTELIESGCRRAGKTQESHSHPKLV
jgi:hypothetical protein